MHSAYATSVPFLVLLSSLFHSSTAQQSSPSPTSTVDSAPSTDTAASSEQTSTPVDGSSKQVIIALSAVIGALLFILLLLIMWTCLYRRRRARRSVSDDVEAAVKRVQNSRRPSRVRSRRVAYLPVPVAEAPSPRPPLPPRPKHLSVVSIAQVPDEDEPDLAEHPAFRSRSTSHDSGMSQEMVDRQMPLRQISHRQWSQRPSRRSSYRKSIARPRPSPTHRTSFMSKSMPPRKPVGSPKSISSNKRLLSDTPLLTIDPNAERDGAENQDCIHSPDESRMSFGFMNPFDTPTTVGPARGYSIASSASLMPHNFTHWQDDDYSDTTSLMHERNRTERPSTPVNFNFMPWATNTARYHQVTLAVSDSEDGDEVPPPPISKDTPRQSIYSAYGTNYSTASRSVADALLSAYRDPDIIEHWPPPMPEPAFRPGAHRPSPIQLGYAATDYLQVSSHASVFHTRSTSDPSWNGMQERAIASGLRGKADPKSRSLPAGYTPDVSGAFGWDRSVSAATSPQEMEAPSQPATAREDESLQWPIGSWLAEPSDNSSASVTRLTTRASVDSFQSALEALPTPPTHVAVRKTPSHLKMSLANIISRKAVAAAGSSPPKTASSVGYFDAKTSMESAVQYLQRPQPGRARTASHPSDVLGAAPSAEKLAASSAGRTRSSSAVETGHAHKGSVSEALKPRHSVWLQQQDDASHEQKGGDSGDMKRVESSAKDEQARGRKPDHEHSSDSKVATAVQSPSPSSAKGRRQPGQTPQWPASPMHVLSPVTPARTVPSTPAIVTTTTPATQLYSLDDVPIDTSPIWAEYARSPALSRQASRAPSRAPSVQPSHQQSREASRGPSRGPSSSRPVSRRELGYRKPSPKSVPQETSVDKEKENMERQDKESTSVDQRGETGAETHAAATSTTGGLTRAESKSASQTVGKRRKASTERMSKTAEE